MKKVLKSYIVLSSAIFLAACGGQADDPEAGTAEAAQSMVAQSASADSPLIAWCMESTPSLEVCACAETALRAEAASDDYEIYAGMGPAYLERRAAGDAIEPAFDAASAEAAERLGMGLGELGRITNRMGAQHRAAINQCKNA